jgi:hypothetical protein
VRSWRLPSSVPPACCCTTPRSITGSIRSAFDTTRRDWRG